MLEALILFYAAWKVEIFISAFLFAAPFLLKRFKNNAILAAFIQQATERIAAHMEAQPIDEKTGKKPNLKVLARRARRQKVRSALAKEARKANRTKKSPKKKGGK